MEQAPWATWYTAEPLHLCILSSNISLAAVTRSVSHPLALHVWEESGSALPAMCAPQGAESSN